MPRGCTAAAAPSASSIVSPGMKRETARRTKAFLVARSRSQRLCEPASSSRRIRPMVEGPKLPQLGAEDPPAENQPQEAPRLFPDARRLALARTGHVETPD